MYDFIQQLDMTFPGHGKALVLSKYTPVLSPPHIISSVTSWAKKGAQTDKKHWKIMD